MKSKVYTIEEHIQDTQYFIDSWMSENKGGTSDATTGVLHLQDSSGTEPARSDGDDVSQASVDGPFKNRTESEKVYCVGCGSETDGGDICDECYLDFEKFPQ